MIHLHIRIVLILQALCFATISSRAYADESPSAGQLNHVRTKVIPLLEARCFKCHKDGDQLRGGLNLASRKAMLAGGDSGPAIIPGKPDESVLIEAVRYAGFEMPPRSKMPAAEIAILERWVADGAPWPKELDTNLSATETFPLQDRKNSHWAWQSIVPHQAPDVDDLGWSKQPMDRFVLSKLETMGLSPAPDADRYTLLRRMYFDIIGLPPTIPQIEAFVNDTSADDVAISKVVDELLASPQFGERWGRHWLDLVRYAETLGHEFDFPLHNAWRYRDYVIRAFNADVPYDQFVREHIAGDLLPEPRRHPQQKFNESQIATGFWFLCEGKHAPVDVKQEEAGQIDNQIDVFSKTFLGMTVACARCHDHKFDAISTADYYALAGFLQSSRRETAWLDQNGEISDRFQQLSIQQQKAQALFASQQDDFPTAAKLKAYVTAAIELVRSKQSFPLSAEAEAKYGDLDQPTLQRWVDVLSDEASNSAANVFSYLTQLAAADSRDSLQQRLALWKKNMVADRRGMSESTEFADLRNGIPEGWFQTGHAFKNERGQTDIELRTGTPVLNSGQGVSSASLSRELRGTLFSPTFELSHPEILVRVSGEATRLRLVIDGYTMNEFSELLFKGCKQKIDTDGNDKWIRLAGDVHRYQGHKAHLEFIDEGNGGFAVKEIRFANRAGARPPKEKNAAINQHLALQPESADSSFETAVDAWLQAVTTDKDTVAQQLLAENLLPSVTAAADWNSVIAEWNRLATDIPAAVPVIALTDGTPENEHVFIRGNHENLGEPAERNILTALRAPTPIDYSGSGRLQLAEQISSTDNPLPARVAVNRVWHHLFCRGIVETTDNFGVLGKRPTHPELLDHLATEFCENGWSVKKMIRTLVLSRTYRMRAQHSKSADTKDPENQFLHRARVRRLTGEAARDAILTVSGRLDKTQFGPPVAVKLTEFMQGRGRPKVDGPLDGNGRRSIYIAVNRNFLSPFMLAFDVPAPVTTTGNRTVSNVPAQALIMLNNQFVRQQAELWATDLLKNSGNPDGDPRVTVISRAWYQLFGRPIPAEELKILVDYQESHYESSDLTVESLAELCHAMLNSKEFLFVR